MASIQRKIRKATRLTGKMLGTVPVLLRKLWGLVSKMTKKTTKKLLNYLRRSLVKKSRRGSRVPSGFVLPTVTMVLLVVALLTTAMVLRSFDRSKNAANFRVNEATLNAAAPALDRARAKIDELFNDPTLPRGTPTDDALIRSMTSTPERYRFGDETQLKLVYDVDGEEGIGEEDPNQNRVEEQETVTTAWKFPVDTDNNGKFDTFTLYGILFRSPPRGGDGFTRRRSPLDARTRPMDEGRLGGSCESSVTTSASFVGDSGWYKSGNKIKKGIFVYAANVPITDLTDTDLSETNYEVFSGGRQGFSALEYQQDRSRIPLTNNAVVYRDDLAIFPGGRLNLNGRVMTNSNLLIGNALRTSDVRLFLISSPESCYYEEEMSKVIVGGNIGAGPIDSNSDDDNAGIDLFGLGSPYEEGEDFGRDNKTVTARGGADLSYNTFAFNQRIDYMVNAALWIGNGSASVITERTNTDEDPDEVQERVEERLEQNPGLDPYEVRKEELENYFVDRTRQVPFAEVDDGESALLTSGGALPSTSADDGITITNAGEANAFFARYTQGSDGTGQNPLRPPFYWMYPFDIDNNANSYTGLTQNLNQPPATDPAMLQGREERVGDRVYVGNNLPAKIFDPDSNQFVDAANYEQVVTGTTWDGSGEDRLRQSQVQELPDLGVTDRDNFWELSAAEAPANDLENIGGLRVITGTGIYLPFDEDVTVIDPPPVWPDYMPVPNDRDDVFDENDNDISSAASDRPYLQMRATAVYHYKHDDYEVDEGTVNYQEPIACVSSYYDPTDENTASNRTGLPENPALPGTGGNSNNGVVYSWSDTLSSNRNILDYQARLEYPNGREVNPLLTEALAAIDRGEQLSLAERTAIDTEICAINIHYGTVAPNTAAMEHGTIYERTFLDPRQIKSIDAHSLRVQWNGASYELADGLGTPDLQDGDIVTLAGFAEEAGENLNFSRETIDVNPADGTFTVLSTIPPAGAAKIGWLTETLSGRYDLSIEERQPLEIRATVLDLNQMRNRTVGSGTPTEYLLPNSGIVYATREDALADETTDGDDGQPSPELSATDFLLDPTRRPNAIMLINGSELNRGGRNDYRVQEKGLVLVSPLPVYIQGDFNLHTGGSGEEFTETLPENWNNFYDRTTLNEDFACRVGQFGPGTCNPGDTWRAATVISDALTLLSDDFREGFRNQGDYDLNNNLGDAESIRKRRENGFYTNDFVTSRGDFTDGDYAQRVGGAAPTNSSYFNNFVTPIQRRAEGNREYLMEVCPKLPVSECGPMDWYVIPPDPLDPLDEGTKANAVIGEDLGGLTDAEILGIISSGTTRIAGNEELRRYPRRVAFFRDYRDCDTIDPAPDTESPIGSPSTCDGDLILDNGEPTADWETFVANNNQGGVNQPIPIGIVEEGSDRGRIQPFPYNNTLLDLDRDGDADELNETQPPDGSTAIDEYLGRGDGSTAVMDPYIDSYINSAAPVLDDVVDDGFLGGADSNGDGVTTVAEFLARVLPEVTTDYSSPVAVEVQDFMSQFMAEPTPVPYSVTAAEVLEDITAAGFFAEEIPEEPTVEVEDVLKELLLQVLQEVRLQNLEALTPSEVEAGLGIQIEDVVDVGEVDRYCAWETSGSDCVNDSDDGRPYRDGDEETLWFVTVDRTPAAGALPEINRRNYGHEHPLFYRTLDGNPISDNSAGEPIPTDPEEPIPGRKWQPLLEPVLQLRATTNSTSGNTRSAPSPNRRDRGNNTYWHQRATAGHTFNVVFASGDTPPRPDESNGGLENFPRFIESWNSSTPARISGGFIQTRRSVFATAPFQVLRPDDRDGTREEDVGIFAQEQIYEHDNASGIQPFYFPPGRLWGFDVGLLTQQPDLFAQRFTVPPTTDPNEFFREVGRDDKWVEVLLCAGQPSTDAGGYSIDDGTGGYFNEAGINYNYAVSSDQRPDCTEALTP